MRRTGALAAVLVATAVLAGASTSAADEVRRDVPHAEPIVAEAGPVTVPGSYVVTTEDPAGAAERRAVAAAADGVPGAVVAPDTFVVRVPGAGSGDDALAALTAVDAVADVQPEHVYTAADVEPLDPCWRGSACLAADGTPSLGGQVELRNVGAGTAWAVTRGSPDVVVAVLDTRIETAPPHRDLVGKLLPGRSFVTDPTCPGATSAPDHGTVAAGLIAAEPANGTDIAGLGWRTRVLPVEVLDDCGRGTTSAVAAGVRWAADNGADVINLSLTGSTRDPAVTAAVLYARARGALVVAAAGNQAGTAKVWPAAEPGVVAVAATGLPGSSGGDRIAPFSNHGPWVDIAAPGIDVIGLRRTGGSTGRFDGTTRASGTSFAAPLVSATAALVMAAHPDLTAEQVARRLAQTAAQIPGSGRQFLWGRLDAGAAVGPLPVGYRLSAADGGLFTFGDAPFAGAAASGRTAAVVGAAAHVSGRGYWQVAADGTVHAFGAAPAFGSPPAQPATAPAVGLAALPGGDGYWVATRDGRVLPDGAAPALGSRPGQHRAPVVGVAASPRVEGYWLVGADGGIFSFGAATFHGSTGGLRLNEPIVGMAPTPSGRGYWLVARDGGIFSFGDALFLGSTGGIRLNQPIVGMATTPSGRGYWLVAADGGIFSFGDASFLGSTGGIRLNRPIVTMVPR